MKVTNVLISQLLLVMLSFFPVSLCAQQEEKDLEYLNNQEPLTQVQTQVGLSILVPTEQSPSNTGVFITQIGANNQSFIQTTSEQSDMNLQQVGNNTQFP